MVTTVTHTRRLERRELSIADAAWFLQLNQAPEMLRFRGDVAFAGEAEARAFLAGCDPVSTETDIGLRFVRASWDQGFSTEAARAFLALGLHCFHLQKIVGRAMRANAASHAALGKLGMSPAFEFEQDGETWVQYEISAGEDAAQL